jgi:polyisoprenoid-binding protein YceI
MKFNYKSLVIVLLLSTALYAQTKQATASQKESYITYQLTHPLHEIESTSKEVDCSIDFDLSKKEIQRVDVRIDVTTFNSGNSNRDSHAMEVIDALSYPEVDFQSKNIYAKGDSIKVQGKLTFHGVTKDITISAKPKWQDKKLYVNGNFAVSLTAFKIERPSLLMIPVKDELRFSFQQVFNF